LANGITRVPAPDSGGKYVIGVGNFTPDRARSAEVAAAIYSKADLVNVELEIIGDPDYIKQDDVFYHPQKFNPARYEDPNTAASNSNDKGILSDNGQIFCSINFKTPQEYNMKSGLMDLNLTDETKYRRSVFSGIYLIIAAKNSFANGLFKQSLTLTRADIDAAEANPEPVQGK
jgi:hypothetical protein